MPSTKPPPPSAPASPQPQQRETFSQLSDEQIRQAGRFVRWFVALDRKMRGLPDLAQNRHPEHPTKQ